MGPKSDQGSKKFVVPGIELTARYAGIDSGDYLFRFLVCHSRSCGLSDFWPTTACRWREAQPGSCKERENLAGDAKGKGPSGANRKAESTDAPERGGLLRSSEEAAVMVVERRGRVIDDESGQLATGGARSSTEGGSLQSMARAG